MLSKPFPGITCELRQLFRVGGAGTTLLLLGALMLVPEPARSQVGADSVTEANQIIQRALRLAANGDTAAALDQLERAVKVAPNLAEAHYQRGLLLARQADNNLGALFKRRAAGRALGKAHNLDRGNPYYILELGRLRLKQGFMRITAQKFFNRALEAAEARGDPEVLAEIEAELGDIYYRRYLSQQNRRLITGAQVRFDAIQAIVDRHYTREFLEDHSVPIPNAGEMDLRTAEDHYRRGVAASPGDEASNLGVLRLLYDNKRFEEYSELARSFARNAPDNSRAHMFRGLGMWRLGRNREADRSFRRALELMNPAKRAAMLNLEPILRRSDAEKYAQLTEGQRLEYQRIYWSLSDPLKLTGENEHQLEFLARLAYADLKFSSPELGLRGWETDRGVIYLRYGPPPVEASFPAQGHESGTDASEVGKITTVWFYPEENLRFVFWGPPGYNHASFAGEFRMYVNEARGAAPIRYDNVPVNKLLDTIPVQSAVFKSRTDSTDAELVLFAGIPLRRMTEGVDLDQGPLERGLFINDPREREVLADRAIETVRFDSDDQFESRTFFSTLEPGDYSYRVEARQPATGRSARGKARVTVPTFTGSELMISDLVLADRISPRTETPGGLGDFLIDPNASVEFEPGETVFLYWEGYNLTPDSTGTVRFQTDLSVRVQSLERRGFGARIVGGVLDAMGTTAEGDEQLTLSFETDEAIGDRDRAPVWLALDLGDAPMGRYQVSVTVRDLVSGQTSTRQKHFFVRSSPETEGQ